MGGGSPATELHWHVPPCLVPQIRTPRYHTTPQFTSCWILRRSSRDLSKWTPAHAGWRRSPSSRLLSMENHLSPHWGPSSQRAQFDAGCVAGSPCAGTSISCVCPGANGHGWQARRLHPKPCLGGGRRCLSLSLHRRCGLPEMPVDLQRSSEARLSMSGGGGPMALTCGGANTCSGDSRTVPLTGTMAPSWATIAPSAACSQLLRQTLCPAARRGPAAGA